MLKDLVPAQVFTFGFGHECACGRPLKNCYTVIAGDFEAARKKMTERWGAKWSHQYPTEEEAGVAKYGLTKVETHWNDEGCPCGAAKILTPGYKPVPVAEAHHLAISYRKAIVVITTYDSEHELIHTTTYAPKEEDKEVAAILGERIATFVGADLSKRTTYEDLPKKS